MSDALPRQETLDRLAGLEARIDYLIDLVRGMLDDEVTT
jgi:hypothetical protein